MAYYRDRGLIELGNEIVTEGIGIGGGFIAGGLVGRRVENLLIKTPVDPSSTLAQKLTAWAVNNGSKAVLYVLSKHYDYKTEITREATKALAGSIVYDTILRLANDGYNPASVSIGSYRILGSNDPAVLQRTLQENSLLRTELNKALQRLAGIDRPLAEKINAEIQSNPARPDSPQDFKYGGDISPAVANRQRNYGAMPWTPDVMERQRRYGAMPFEQNPSKTNRERAFGFMEPHETRTNVAQMFNMQ